MMTTLPRALYKPLYDLTMSSVIKSSLPISNVRPLAAAAAALATTGMWLAIALSPVRWDFYRFLGGDLKRRGETAAALAAYEHAEQYAPAGVSRRARIIELRKQLRKP